jgi:hypothetical protein
MNNTYTPTNTINQEPAERPWWTVRRPLLATLAVATIIWIAIIAPTPLSKWIFGEHLFVALTK